MRRVFPLPAVCAASLLAGFAFAGERPQAAPPTRDVVVDALRRATKFMHETVADHGGYAWVSSADGGDSHGEGVAGPDRVWVQPPGTPAVGQAFLDAYQATGDPRHLQAARDVASALLAGQLRSGGWGYSIPFAEGDRDGIPFRVSAQGRADLIEPTPSPGGWDLWKRRRHKNNQTVLDDDTTASAIRFLVRFDQLTNFQEPAVGESAKYALRSAIAAQYPCGAWSHRYDQFPLEPPSEAHYPRRNASFPESWSRSWTKDFTGCYMLNDRISLDMIETMWIAWRVYGDERYRDSVIRGGEFLLAAQLPEPSPAWAQQYNRHMQPVWDRQFEPPAVSGFESQAVLETLLDLYRWTGQERFLEPVPRAIRYLRRCQRDDGRLARFYELGTTRPLYFTQDYRLTSDDSQVPDHYAFVVPSRLDRIEAGLSRLRRDRESAPSAPPPSDAEVAEVLAAQRSDGAWLTPGFVRDQMGNKRVPPEGVVDSRVFINRVDTLTRWLAAHRAR